MNYFLHSPMAGRGTDLEIDETAFRQLDEAKSRLAAILGFEECFALLADNHSEFEQELVDLALSHMLRTNPLDPATAYAAIHALNRRLLNLLTAYRFYLDYAQHHHASFGYQKAKDVWAEFESNSQLKLARELRNYAQHHGVLISEISYPSGWEDRNGQERQVMRCAIVPVFDRSNIKTYMPGELSGQLGDPTYFVRRIIEGIGAIHERLRSRHDKPFAESRETFHQALLRFEGPPEQIFAVDHSKQIARQIAVTENTVRRIEHIRESYGYLPTLSRRYLSNESSQLR